MLLAGYALVLVLFAVELAVSERLPLAWWLIAVAFAGLHLMMGVTLGGLRWIALPLLLVPILWVVTALSQQAVILLVGLPAALAG